MFCCDVQTSILGQGGGGHVLGALVGGRGLCADVHGGWNAALHQGLGGHPGGGGGHPGGGGGHLGRVVGHPDQGGGALTGG